MNTEAPFVRGTGIWSGVVLVERPKNPQPDTLCQVSSARTLALDGKRAIFCKLPYKMFKHYFTAIDQGEVCVYAEYKDEHLEFYERASKREYFLHASNSIN